MTSYVYLGPFKTSNSDVAKQKLIAALRDSAGLFAEDEIINTDVHVVINIKTGTYSIAPMSYITQGYSLPLYEELDGEDKADVEADFLHGNFRQDIFKDPTPPLKRPTALKLSISGMTFFYNSTVMKPKVKAIVKGTAVEDETSEGRVEEQGRSLAQSTSIVWDTPSVLSLRLDGDEPIKKADAEEKIVRFEFLGTVDENGKKEEVIGFKEYKVKDLLVIVASGKKIEINDTEDIIYMGEVVIEAKLLCVETAGGKRKSKKKRRKTKNKKTKKKKKSKKRKSRRRR